MSQNGIVLCEMKPQQERPLTFAELQTNQHTKALLALYLQHYDTPVSQENVVPRLFQLMAWAQTFVETAGLEKRDAVLAVLRYMIRETIPNTSSALNLLEEMLVAMVPSVMAFFVDFEKGRVRLGEGGKKCTSMWRWCC